MKLIFSLFLFSLSLLSYGQSDWTFQDSRFSYDVNRSDYRGKTEGSVRECIILDVQVKDIKTGQLVADVIVPGNHTLCDRSKREVFQVVDVNFDGYKDFIMLKSTPASGNEPFYYFVFKPDSKTFVRDTSLEKITNPEVDEELKEIYSFHKDGPNHSMGDTYKYVNGKITLVQRNEIQHHPEKKGATTITLSKLVDGEFKMIEQIEEFGAEEEAERAEEE